MKGLYGGNIRPKTGAPRMFEEELEGLFALYMKHCSLLRVPCTRTLLREDILHYVQYKSLTVDKMPEDGPGKVHRILMLV